MPVVASRTGPAKWVGVLALGRGSGCLASASDVLSSLLSARTAKAFAEAFCGKACVRARVRCAIGSLLVVVRLRLGCVGIVVQSLRGWGSTPGGIAVRGVGAGTPGGIAVRGVGATPGGMASGRVGATPGGGVTGGGDETLWCVCNCG